MEKIKQQAELYAESFRYKIDDAGWYEQKVRDFIAGYEAALRLSAVMPSLHSEPKTKDDMLLEILAQLGTEIPDPTGEYADLFAYLYDKISPLLSNET